MSEHEDRGASREKGFIVEVPGLPPVRFLGWRSTHAEVVFKASNGKMKWRAVVEALAECSERYGAIPAIGRAILRPGDTFDRETGKKIALARLVEALVPTYNTYQHPAESPEKRAEAKRLNAKAKQARSRLFLEIWRRTHKGKMPEKAGRVWCLGSVVDPFHGKRDPEWRETLRGGGIPRGPIQGQTASTVIFDEVSKWPTPEAPDMKKPPSPEEAKA